MRPRLPRASAGHSARAVLSDASSAPRRKCTRGADRARAWIQLLVIGVLGATMRCGGLSSEPSDAGPDGAAPAWSLCSGSGTCTVAGRGCCGGCGRPTLDDVDAVNADPAMMAAHRGETCSDPNPVCPACPTMPEPNLVAMCVSGQCSKLDLRTDPVSSCRVDDDCMLRTAPCCEPCVVAPGDLVAISKQAASSYQAGICTPAQACPACVPQYPAGYGAICNPAGHCEVAIVACPPEVPRHGSSCSGDDRACEYGQDLRLGCRTHAQCHAGAWEIAISGCPPLPGPGQDGCPSDASATGLCDTDGLLCDMQGGAVCACGACLGPCSMEKRWWCAGPGAAPCPAIAPELGSACSGDETACIYGVCGTTTSAGRRCVDRTWRDEPVACPN
jgi:hypothetical protein